MKGWFMVICKLIIHFQPVSRVRDERIVRRHVCSFRVVLWLPVFFSCLEVVKSTDTQLRSSVLGQSPLLSVAQPQHLRNNASLTFLCLYFIYQGIKQELRTKATLSTPQITRVNSSEISTTLNGNPCNETWDKANSRDVCRYIDRIELHGLPSKRKQP